MLNLMRAGGALLVAAAGVLAGLGAAREYALRERELRDLAQALARMRAEIELRLTPMPELFALLAREGGGSAPFFEALSREMESENCPPLESLWEETVSRTFPPGASRDALVPLGAFLGGYDGPEECAAIARAEERLQAALTAAETERRIRGPLALRLFAATGAGLAILFL